MDVLLSLVPPEEVTDLVPFRPAMPDGTWLEGYLDPSATGRVSQCGTEAMLCRGSRIQMHCSQTGQLCAELCLRRRQERLLAGPFVYFRRTGRDFVAMAAQGALGSPSLLCVCHIPTECVVRAIHLPAPATHMAVVSVDRLGRLPGGWLAVATEDRWLLLLGLCLDSFPHHTDESKPLGLGALEGLCSPPALLETPVHPCVHVCHVKGLVGSEDVDGDVEVSCLEWLPQLGCLGIGLSCGTVHLWDVQRLTPVFAVELPSDLPVVALAVQEPEDDPRCCCYLWVAQGATSVPAAAALGCCSVATMHSVTYESKEPDGRSVYQEFKHTRQVFEYPLEPRVVGNADSGLQPALDGGELASRIVSFRTVPPPLGPRRKERTEDDPGVLLFLSWQLVRGRQVVGSYLSVFDINQWYRERMPQVFWLNAHQLCSYMGLFSLGEAVAKCGDVPLLDVRVAPSSLQKYRSPDPLVEQAHFPSALSFACVCLTAEGTVHASFLGMQRQLLHDMNLAGPQCLHDAPSLCARLFRVGLVDDGIGLAALQSSPAAARGMLLDVALEHRMVVFLVACLRGHTRTVGNPAAEPLLPFVLNWTWAKVTEAKAFLDELYVPLFNCSGQDVSEVVQRMSIHLEELSILHRLLEHACGMDADDPGLVETRCDVVGLLTTHLRALLFLLHCGVLPDNHMDTGLVSYPWATLRAWCLQARRDVGGKLLVDVLAEMALARTGGAAPSVGWQEYPPPSIQRATDVYLRRGLQPWAPRALTYYLLLDISAVFVREHPHVQEHVQHFPDAFSTGADLQALVQGLWSLDHGHYQEGLEQLQRAHSLAGAVLRPVLGALCGPAVRLLLRRGGAALAVCGLGCLPAPSTPEELSLQLDVLLANSQIIEALELVRRHDFASMDQLLGSLVAVAKSSGPRSAQQQLQLLLQSPLRASEEDRLAGFLCELADPVWLSQAALHYLHCGRPRSAYPLTAALRGVLLREGGRTQQQRPYPTLVLKRAAATVELMQSFLRIVPSAASKQSTAAGRGVLDLPMHLLRGARSARQPRTTVRLASTGGAAGASGKLPGYRAPALPRPPDRLMTGKRPSVGSFLFGGQQRRSLSIRLEEEALSILRTPLVGPWQPPAAGESSVGGPAPASTPASILKRRAAAPLASTPTEEGHVPPSPPAVDDIVPTTEPTIRKLRFAISDSSLSATGADLDSASARSSELDHSRGNSKGMASFTKNGRRSREQAQASITALNDPAGPTRGLPEQLDVSIVGSPPCEEESACATRLLTAGPTKDGAAADVEEDLALQEDEDGLDGTPLEDEKDDLEANCKGESYAPLDETGGFRGSLPVPAAEEEGAKLETESVISCETEKSAVAPPAPLGPCSGPALEQVPDLSSEELAMLQPVPEFAGSGREAGPDEQVTEAGASEASGTGKTEKEDDSNATVLSKSSSEALPHPSDMESQEPDGSRSLAATNGADKEDGVVYLEGSVCEGISFNMEGDIESQGSSDMEMDIGESDGELEEPLQAVREASLGFLPTTAHAEGVEVERPLLDGDSAALIPPRKSLLPKALADQEPSEDSVAEMLLGGTADAAPALDLSSIQEVESDVKETAAAAVEVEPSPVTHKLLPKIIVTHIDSSLPSAEPSSVEDGGVVTKKLFSPPTSPKHSSLKVRLDFTSEKGPKKEGAGPVEDSGEPSSPRGMSVPRYDLRERHKCSVKDKEARAEPTRKARAASEEPKSSHSRQKACHNPANKPAKQRASRKSATPSPSRKTANTRERTQTPSPGRELIPPSPEATGTPRRSKRASSASRSLALPSSSRTSATPSPRRKKRRSRESTQTPSPKRKARTPTPEGEAGMHSPQRMDSPGCSKRNSTASRRLATRGPTPSPRRKTPRSRQMTETPSPSPKARTPTPERGAGMRSPARMDIPECPKRASTVRERLVTPSPPKHSAAQSPKKGVTMPAARKRAATLSHNKQPSTSPAKTPTHQSRLTKTTATHEVEDPSQSAESQSAAAGAGHMGAAAQDARTPSPTRKAARKGTRGGHRTSTDTVQAEPAMCSSARDKSPAEERRGGEAGALASPSVQQKVPTGPTRSTSAGTKTGTVAEVDDNMFVEGDGEQVGPSTSTRPKKPAGTLQMRLRSAGHQLPSGTALSTIAEVPTAEGEVAAPARRGQQGKRKASEEAGATSEEAEQGAAAVPSSTKVQAPLRKKGKKPSDSAAAGTSLAPPAGSARAKPITRSCQWQDKGAAAAAKESSSSSEDDVPET